MKLKVTVAAETPAADLLALLHEADQPLGEDQATALPEGVEHLAERFSREKGETELYAFIGENPAAVLLLSTAQVKHHSRSEKLKVLASRALAFAEKHKLSSMAIPCPDAETAAAVTEGLCISSYRFEHYKSKPKPAQRASVTLVVPATQLKEAKTLVARAEVLASSMAYARDLVNEPAEAMYPAAIAETARAFARKLGLKIEILDEKALTRGNYNGILAVGKGSVHPPRLIIVQYKPKTKTSIHLALVGKAVAFDTGGHSIKPAKDLWQMKGDMAGGAAVLGAMMAIAQLKPNIQVTALVPSVINAIDNKAILPGDIIRSRSGKTVHVDNTDAEGRLILMDALDRAQDEGATHVVDAATLTGSIVRALGTSVSGIFGTDDELVQAICDAGNASGEDFWRMPLIDEYRSQLDHPIADMDNVGKSINAGAIVAALFLREFIRPETRWAHLDIAGTGLHDFRWKYFSPGATGIGVRTFVGLAESLAAEKPADISSRKK